MEPSNKRLVQWLIPFLYGVAVAIIFASTVELLVAGRDAVSTYVSPLGIAALLVAVLLKVRTGYNWPWEGSAEWADVGESTAKAFSKKAFLRNFALWVIIVMVLLALFTLFQYRFA